MPKGFMHPARTSAERKESPTSRGCVRYFPAALELVGRLSKIGNDKHNPGEEMHHARGRSNDHGDCIIRHQMDVGKIDEEHGLDHAVGVAWRALAQLQELAEKQYGWPIAPGAKLPEVEKPARVKVGDRFKDNTGKTLIVDEVFETGGRSGFIISIPHVWFTEDTWISIEELLDDSQVYTRL